MEPYAKRCGKAGVMPLSEESADGSGQHIAGTGDGELRDIPGRNDSRSSRNGDERSRSLEYPYCGAEPAQGVQSGETISLYLGCTYVEQGGSFSGMRGKHITGA
jgi:hypothetical protein